MEPPIPIDDRVVGPGGGGAVHGKPASWSSRRDACRPSPERSRFGSTSKAPLKSLRVAEGRSGRHGIGGNHCRSVGRAGPGGSWARGSVVARESPSGFQVPPSTLSRHLALPLRPARDSSLANPSCLSRINASPYSRNRFDCETSIVPPSSRACTRWHPMTSAEIRALLTIGPHVDVCLRDVLTKQTMGFLACGSLSETTRITSCRRGCPSRRRSPGRTHLLAPVPGERASQLLGKRAHPPGPGASHLSSVAQGGTTGDSRSR